MVRRSPLLWTIYGKVLPLLYDRFAFAYVPITQGLTFGQYRRWRRLTLQHLLLGPTLEVACGPADLFPETQTCTGIQPVGLDRSRAMLCTAKRRLHKSGNPPRLVQADALALPFQEGSFTNVLSLFPAPFVLDEAFFHESFRILRVGGRLVIGAPWISIPRPLAGLPPFNSPAQADLLAQHLALAATQAGFSLRFFVYHSSLLVVPVIVFSKSTHWS